MIPYAKHSLDRADEDAVLRVLQSDRLTQGEQVDAFEREFARVVDAPYAVSFSSGTAALHAAVAVSMDWTGDTWTSALGFVASANAPVYVGSKPHFVDIDPQTWNISPEMLIRALGGGTSGLKREMLIPVHFAGLPAPTKALRPFGKIIIEDACHALGARTEDGPVGNCAYSDFTCFSFHPAKAITTGEGGMVTCRIKEHVKALKKFRNHGFTLSQGHYREQTSLGYNYRLSDIHAALGRSQLVKLPQFIERRHEIAGRYLEELDGVVKLPPYSPHHAWHLFVIRVAERDRVYDELRKRGIQCQVHYVPLYRNPFHEIPFFSLPNVEAYYEEALSLPIFPSLTDREQTEVIEAVKSSVGHRSLATHRRNAH